MTSMHILTTLIRHSGLLMMNSKEAMNLGGRRVGQFFGDLMRGSRSGYDESVLCACMKFSRNKT